VHLSLPSGLYNQFSKGLVAVGTDRDKIVKRAWGLVVNVSHLEQNLPTSRTGRMFCMQAGMLTGYIQRIYVGQRGTDPGIDA